MKSNILRYWLALRRAPKVSAGVFMRLLSIYPDLTQIFQASRSELIKQGLLEATINYLKAPDWHAVENDLAWQQADKQQTIVSIDSPDYPMQLKMISVPPPLLFVRGNLQLLSQPQLAIVGSRNPTPIGLENARYFARALAERGLTITSGLALGIDAAGHQGALQSTNSSTIAVTGNGLEKIYPSQNLALAKEIAQRGALVSEYSPDTLPRREHFPQRNRIISGLSLGVLVVEAAIKSGSLITARYALEQGREVFAVPGSIHNPQARGCHILLRQGAKLAENIDDVLEELAFLLKWTLKTNKVSKQSSNQHTALTRNACEIDTKSYELAGEAGRLLQYIGFEPTLVDDIIELSGLNAQVIAILLTELEIKGYIFAVPGGYIRT